MIDGNWTPNEQDRVRWQREAEFFDTEEYSLGKIPEIIIERYLNLPKPWLPAEFPFSVLGDLKGKRILEVGCGDGSNAIILALRGAEVLGLDISPRAIEIATERAQMHNLSGRARFACTPLELFVQSSNREQFDIICGFAVLHHLLPVLDSFLSQLKQLAHPDTRFLFTEPIALWTWLRRLRLTLPIPVHGTPDERPLELADLAIIFRQFPGMQATYFGMLTRIFNRLLTTNYEEAQAWQRSTFDMAAHCDHFVLETMSVKGLASMVVLYSPPGPKP